MQKSELDTLDNGGYRALVTQLAIATGAPELSPVWHDTLKKYRGNELDELRNSLKAAKGYEGAFERPPLDGALECYAALEPLRTYAPIAQRYSFKGWLPRPALRRPSRPTCRASLTSRASVAGGLPKKREYSRLN